MPTHHLITKLQIHLQFKTLTYCSTTTTALHRESFKSNLPNTGHLTFQSKSVSCPPCQSH
jgi:hypothetical protein